MDLDATLATLSYTSNLDYFGADTLTYSVTDGTATTNEATISITVNNVNDAPVLEGIGTQTSNEDTPKDVTLSATDVDEDSLTYSATNSDNITSSVTGTTLTLTPADNFYGTESITVTVDDGNDGIDTETINVTFTAVNDLPVLSAIGAQSVDEDNAKIVTLSATYIEDTSLTFSATSTASQVGVEVSGNQLTLTPEANWYGTSNITVTVTDTEDGTDEETFTLTVNSINDLPTIENPGSQEFTEKDVLPVALTVSDIETESPTISVETSDPGLEASVEGTTLSLTSDGWYGDATVTVTVTDEDEGTDSTTFDVQVTPFNIHPPVHTVPGEQQIDTSVPYTFSIATENAIQVSDLDSPTVTTTLEVQYGILKLHQTTGLQFLEGTTDNSAKLVITGAIGM